MGDWADLNVYDQSWSRPAAAVGFLPLSCWIRRRRRRRRRLLGPRLRPLLFGLLYCCCCGCPVRTTVRAVSHRCAVYKTNNIQGRRNESS
jgi:hypothetical protein